MSESERSKEIAGAIDQFPGKFIPASIQNTWTDDYLAPHRDLNDRDIPEINAYNPSQCTYVIFHEIDDDYDPSGTAYIEADEQSVVNTEDMR